MLKNEKDARFRIMFNSLHIVENKTKYIINCCLKTRITRHDV